MKKRAKPLAPEDWFGAAFALLKSEGHHRVTLRDLCAELGVSTGSFYHHFSNRDDFVERLFDFWSDRGKAAIQELVKLPPRTLNDVNEHINALLDHRLEAAMRAWGLFDSRVAVKIRQIDEARRTFFKQYYASRFSVADARQIIDLHLCSLVGAQFMFLDQPRALDRFGGFVNDIAESLAASQRGNGSGNRSRHDSNREH